MGFEHEGHIGLLELVPIFEIRVRVLRKLVLQLKLRFKMLDLRIE